MHATGAAPPSPWITRFAGLIPTGGTVLDVACGSGRHARWLAERGWQVTGVDRDAAALSTLPSGVRALQADIEQGPWPLPGEQFDALVVTNYLWRPLWPVLLASLRPGAVVLVETFAAGNETVGRPARPEFLLRPGELLQVFGSLSVVAFEDGFAHLPSPRFVQRIACVNRPAADTPRPRFALDAPG